MPTTTLITLPSPTGVLSALGEWSSPFFNEMFPIAIYGLGIVVGAIIIHFFIKMLSWGFSHLVWGRAASGDEAARGYVRRHPDQF